MKFVMEIYEEAKNLSTTEDRKAFLLKYSECTSFMVLLQYAFSPLHSYENVKFLCKEDTDRTHTLNGKKFDNYGFMDVVKFLENDRATFGLASDFIYSKFCHSNPDLQLILGGIINGNLFGFDRAAVNSLAPFPFLPEIASPSIVTFKPELLKKAGALSHFPKIPGGFVNVVKCGNFIEVYSKQGKMYRIFDDIRKAFKDVPVDGQFIGQLYYKNSDGEADMKAFFSETARKEQSKNFFLELFDFIPLADRQSRVHASLAEYSSRYLAAKFAHSFLSKDKRFLMAWAGRCEVPSGSLVIADASKEFSYMLRS